MAGGDHDTAVKFVRPGHIGDGGGGGDMQQISICAGSGDASGQRILKHIAGAAGVLADDDPGIFFDPFPALQFAVVPAQETAHLEGMVCRQIFVGFTTEAVGSKIFTHRGILLSKVCPVKSC